MKFRNRRLLQLRAGLASAICVLLLSVSPALADGPSGPPQSYWGTVKVAGTLTGAGVTVTARSGNTQLDSTTTDDKGIYGISISSSAGLAAGATIEFYVNGVKAAQTATYDPGAIVTQLHLTAATAGAAPASQPVSIATSALAGGTVGVSYSQALQAAGGTSPYTWSVVPGSGSLPPGLGITSGIITGTPTAAGSYTFTLKVTDSAATASTASSAFTIAILAPQSSQPQSQPQSQTSTATTPTPTPSATASSPSTAPSTSTPASTAQPSSVVTSSASPAVTEVFTASDLVVTPESVGAGDEVKITLKVKNNSSMTDSKSIILRINNKNEAQEVVTLDGGKSQIVSFTVTRKDSGIYRVSVEGLGASFEVTGAGGKGASQPVDATLIITIAVIGGGILVIVLLAVLLARQRYR